MWRNDRDRPDDPRTPVRETQRLAQDEYDRPRYGSPPPDYRVRGDVERLRVHTAMTEVVGAVSEPIYRHR